MKKCTEQPTMSGFTQFIRFRLDLESQIMESKYKQTWRTKWTDQNKKDLTDCPLKKITHKDRMNKT